MIERIIFIVLGGFTLRDYKRHGISRLQQNGFDVEVWDLTGVVYPKDKDNFIQTDLLKFNGLTFIDDKSEMIYRVSNLSHKDFLINTLTYDQWSLGVYRALSRSQSQYGVLCTNMLPTPNFVNSWAYRFKRLKNLIMDNNLLVWNSLFMKFPLRLSGIKPARLVLMGGEKSFCNQYPVDDRTEFLQLHAYDYDLYLEERKKPSIEKPIAVFLDDQFTLSPEVEMYGVRPNIATERYFYLINRFFDIVEKKTGFEVVIAAHPRSNAMKNSTYFSGRKCIKNKTVRLVKESKLVLVHCSTAISFANLFYKPAIFMTFSEIKNSSDDYWIKELAKYHGKKPIILNEINDVNFGEELRVDRDSYNNYRRLFIKTEESQDLPFWQIVAQRIAQWGEQRC